MSVIERSVVRAVVLDAHDRVLLFHARDPTYPELGTWWELPGGGIEGAERYDETVVRELAEEAGIAIRPDQVGAPTWRRRATFRYRVLRCRAVELRRDHGPEARGRRHRTRSGLPAGSPSSSRPQGRSPAARVCASQGDKPAVRKLPSPSRNG